MLFTEVRLATERDDPVAVMIKKVVREYLLTNAEGDVLVANISWVTSGRVRHTSTS